MRFVATLFPAILLASGLSTPCRAGDLTDYLAKDGNLRETLTLAIGGNHGEKCEKYWLTVWVIEPSGAWTQKTRWSTWLRANETLAAKGQLTERQRLALALHLATQDFKGLPARVPGKTQPGNVRSQGVLQIDFGKKSTKLETGDQPVFDIAGTFVFHLADSAAKADDPKAGEWSRFAALTLVLDDMLKQTKTDAKKTGNATKAE